MDDSKEAFNKRMAQRRAELSGDLGISTEQGKQYTFNGALSGDIEVISDGETVARFDAKLSEWLIYVEGDELSLNRLINTLVTLKISLEQIRGREHGKA